MAAACGCIGATAIARWPCHEPPTPARCKRTVPAGQGVLVGVRRVRVDSDCGAHRDRGDRGRDGVDLPRGAGLLLVAAAGSPAAGPGSDPPFPMDRRGDRRSGAHVRYLLGPYVLNAVGAGAADPDADFRVATFNLTNGRPVDSLAGLIAAHQPDVLLLQEVTSSREELAALAPDYPYASMGPGVRGPGNDGYAILSRYPITAVRPVTDLPRDARPADLVTVNIDGRDVALLSIHLASPCIGCPADTSYPGGGTASAARMRVAEARRYAEVAKDLLRHGEAVVVGGDINASPLNRPLHAFTAVGLTDAQRDVGTSPGLTRGPGPGVARVDVVLVGGLTPITVVEGACGHSTHSPVIADLAWR